MKTIRGFELQYFNDDFDAKCSIQESSSIEPRICLGIDNPKINVLLGDAEDILICKQKEEEGRASSGWREYILPEYALVSSRMHLNRKQAKKLAKKLLYFAFTGRLNKDK